MRYILGTASVKGIGAALSDTRQSLRQAGIRLDEAVSRKTVRKRSVWTPGPAHPPGTARPQTSTSKLDEAQATAPGADRGSGARTSGTVLVLRALKSKGEIYRIDGGMAGLDEILDDEWFDFFDDKKGLIGEVFIDRIEPGSDARELPVPEGYGENGIWIRGQQDYAEPRVSGAIGTGRYGAMTAWIGEATWIERRFVLVDAVQHVNRCSRNTRFCTACIRTHGRTSSRTDASDLCNGSDRSAVPGCTAPAAANATPVLVRDRCRDQGAQAVRAPREGLRGDETRTATRAIANWRKTNPARANEPVAIQEIRIAKRQPRPMPPP